MDTSEKSELELESQLALLANFVHVKQRIEKRRDCR